MPLQDYPEQQNLSLELTKALGITNPVISMKINCLPENHHIWEIETKEYLSNGNLRNLVEVFKKYSLVPKEVTQEQKED
jgi:hypothetical protein